MDKNLRIKTKLRLTNFLLFIFLISFSIWRIYVYSYKLMIALSPDSAAYLREAICILHGFGFNCDGLVGINSWFSTWPIGYPLSIALFSLLTAKNVYVASKILNIFCLLVYSFIIVKYCDSELKVGLLTIINPGYLYIQRYTWSENLFILFFLLFSLLLTQFITGEHADIDVKNRLVLPLILSGISCFLFRYFGIIILVELGVVILFFFIFDRKEVLRKITGLYIAAIAIGVFDVIYLCINKIMSGASTGERGIHLLFDSDLFENLVESIIAEISHVFLIEEIANIVNSSCSVWVRVFIILIFSSVLLWIIKIWGTKKEKVLVLVAVTYYSFFIMVRFLSYMDPFGTRFFTPATLIIQIVLYDIIFRRISSIFVDSKKLRIFYGFCLFSVCIILGLFVMSDVKKINSYNDIAYVAEVDNRISLMKDIPNKSVVVDEIDSFDYYNQYYRPDCLFVMVNNDEDIEQIIEKYYSDHPILINKKMVMKNSDLMSGFVEVNACNEYFQIEKAN